MKTCWKKPEPIVLSTKTTISLSNPAFAEYHNLLAAPQRIHYHTPFLKGRLHKRSLF